MDETPSQPPERVLPEPTMHACKCVECGYSLEGLAHSAQCPECRTDCLTTLKFYSVPRPPVRSMVLRVLWPSMGIFLCGLVLAILIATGSTPSGGVAIVLLFAFFQLANLIVLPIATLGLSRDHVAKFERKRRWIPIFALGPWVGAAWCISFLFASAVVLTLGACVISLSGS